MNRELKKMLMDAFEAPPPQRKQTFLKRVGYRKVSYCQFIWRQASYISRWTWGGSFVLFLAALIGGRILGRDVLWLLSAMMPFLAVTFVTENFRSEIYGMAELELASRFSLRSVVFARMGILGMAHFGVLCLAALSGIREGGPGIFRMGVYLLTPYLLTDAGGLWLSRRLRGKEAVYANISLAVIVSLLPDMAGYAMASFYQAETFGWWLAALAVLSAATVLELKKSIKRTEELAWNL